MSTTVLPRIREASDITMLLQLQDSGVAIDWSSLSNINVLIFSDRQKVISGRCTHEVDQSDNTILRCEYSADSPQYIGVNSVVVRCTYRGRVKTYDKKAFKIVPRTEDLAGQDDTIESPVVDVDISVEDVSSTLLENAIAAAFDAAEEATQAKEAAIATNAAIEAAETARAAQATSDHNRAQSDHERAEADHARVGNEIFYVQKGVTTYAEMRAAYNAGKALVIRTLYASGDDVPCLLPLVSKYDEMSADDRKHFMFGAVFNDGDESYMLSIEWAHWSEEGEHDSVPDYATKMPIYIKPSGGIPESDLAQAVQEKLNAWETEYFDNTATYDDVLEAYQDGAVCFMDCTVELDGDTVGVLLPLVSVNTTDKVILFVGAIGIGEQQGSSPSGAPMLLTYSLVDGVRTTGVVVTALPEKADVTTLATAIANLPIEKGTGVNSLLMKVADGGSYVNAVSGENSMATGKKNTVSGANAGAVGYGNTVGGLYGFASGRGNTVPGQAASACGRELTTSNDYEHAVGRHNIPITGSRFVVGIGTANAGKNGLLVMDDGKIYVPGVGGFTGEETAASQLAGKDLAANMGGGGGGGAMVIAGHYDAETADFFAAADAPTWEEATAAFIAGTPVLLMIAGAEYSAYGLVVKFDQSDMYLGQGLFDEESQEEVWSWNGAHD